MSIRFAYLLKKFPRLSETFVLNEILGQEKLGRSIHVFSRRTPDDEPRHPELGALRAEVENMPDKRTLDPWQTMSAADDDPEETFARVGKLVQSSRDWFHPRFASLLKEAIYLLGRTQALGIEHVHTHFATDSAVVAMLLRELGGPTYSITAHAKDIYRTTVDPGLLSRMFARSEFAVTVCDANVSFLGDRLSPEGFAKVRRLYNGIDLSAFFRSTSEREPDHVLAVGRLVEKKGFHVLLSALSDLGSRGVPYRAPIVGHGEERARLEAQIAELELGDRVRLTGALDQDAVRKLMRSATVLCQPCIQGEDGNRDALPTVLLEALATGLPSISTPVTGIPEILDDGRAGLIVPENDVEATSRALEAVLGDAAHRKTLADLGRERAESLFDIEKNSRILGSWFDEALDKQGEPCVSRA